MNKVTSELVRYYTPMATMGEMKVFLPDGSVELFVTVEKPWRGNKPFQSCIPEGVYSVRRHISPRFGACFKVFDVHGRTDILIHVGNTESSVMGCIALGSSFGNAYNVRKSTDACNRLLAMFEDDEFTLTISPFRADYP